MNNDQTILKLVPSLQARRLPDGQLVLTRKFIEGVNEFQKVWAGPVSVYVDSAENQYANLDELPFTRDDFSFEIHVLPFSEIVKEVVSDRAAVVLLSLDDARQNDLGALCRERGIPCAYISEYSLTTRKQIVDAGTTNPLLRVRRKLWETQQESKRRLAVASATGLQCNGTPTYDSYAGLRPDALLFFDTRVSADLLATDDEIRKRVAASLARGCIRLLFSGRLVAAKGAGQLVEVAKSLRDLNVDYHLSICGDGDMKPFIADQIRAAKLSDKVALTGVLEFKKELVPFVKSSIDLFVCCHPQGDPSCTYLETMSCGVPIAGYDNEAFEGIVRHSGCGWAVPANQPRALAAKIAEVWKSQESLLKMSLASLAFARKHTFDLTFSRRIHHLRTLAQSGAKKMAAAVGAA